MFFIGLAFRWDRFLRKPAFLGGLTLRLSQWTARRPRAQAAAAVGFATPLLPCGPLYFVVSLALLSGSALRGVEYIEGTRFDDVFDARGFSRSSVNAGGEQSYWMGMTNAYAPLGGNDTVIGNGFTRLTFTSAMMGIEANLAEGFVDALATDAVTRASPEYLYTVGRTTFTGVYQIDGTDYADILIGSRRASR